MAIIDWGYAGTIGEVQWAQMAQMLGNDYCVDAPASLAVTSPTGTRNLVVSTGLAFGKGIVSQVGANETLPLPVPTSGAWHLLVLRRVWGTKKSTFVLIPGATVGSTAIPTAPPSLYPAGLTQLPGNQDDMPVAWAFVNSANTNVGIWQLTKMPGAASINTFWSDAQRDAYYTGLSSLAARVNLQNSQPQVRRPDLGWTEQYFAEYDATTNPRGLRTAGWYPVSGALPAFLTYKKGTQAAASGTWAVMDGVFGGASPAPELSRGFTSFSSGALTVAYAGYYDIRTGYQVSGAANNRGTQVTKNSVTADTANTVIKNELQALTGSASGLVLLAKGDVIRVMNISGQTGTLGVNQGDTFLAVSYNSPA